MLLKIPFFVNNFSVEFIKKLMTKVEEIHFSPEEIIY